MESGKVCSNRLVQIPEPVTVTIIGLVLVGSLGFSSIRYTPADCRTGLEKVPLLTLRSAEVNCPVPVAFTSTGNPSSRKRIVTGLGI